MILKLSLEIDIGLMKDYFKHVLHLPMNFLIHVKAEKYYNVLWILQKFVKTVIFDRNATCRYIYDYSWLCIIIFTKSNAVVHYSHFYTIFILCSLMMKQPFEHYNQKVAENDAELSSYLIESFDGSSTIKSYQSEPDRFEQGSQKFNQLINNLIRLGQLSNIQLTINNFLKITVSLVILWIGSYFVMNDQMTLGSLLAFNALTIFI